MATITSTDGRTTLIVSDDSLYMISKALMKQATSLRNLPENDFTLAKIANELRDLSNAIRLVAMQPPTPSRITWHDPQ